MNNNKNLLKNPEPLNLKAQGLDGHIDYFENGVLFGWACDFDRPHEAIKVSIYHDDKIIGSGYADVFRKDLFDKKIGTGKYGFKIKISLPQYSKKIFLHLVCAKSGKKLSSRKFDLVTHSTIGKIEDYTNGFIYGWAYDSEFPEKSLNVAIYSDEKKIGEGHANLCRKDLIDAEVGCGWHGFKIRIPPQHQSQKFSLDLVCLKSGEKISSKEYQPISKSSPEIEFDLIEYNHLKGRIHINSSDEELPLYFFGDTDNIVESKDVATRIDKFIFQFSIPIPVSFYDGMPHVLTVGLCNYERSEASYVTLLPPQVTASHFNFNLAVNQIGSNSISSTSGYRYESLQKQLQNLERFSSELILKKLQNLQLAHQVVVEGWQNRKSYPQLSLPSCDKPDVSILIPVFNNFEVTYHCLASILLAHNVASYEVILIDDASTDKTTEIDNIINNLHLIVNENNLGYLLSCNKAAMKARGEYLVLLNNDTEVTSGWLDEQISIFNQFDHVGLTGSKLLYPDGSLQEAGGIIYANGEAWNAGKSDNQLSPEWCYTRQVDYLSGASLMLPHKIWQQLGGYSKEFAPAYYEDVDLAFKVRDAGYKTVYVPYSIVIHFEGMSNGKDLNRGIKKNQLINAPKFYSKWVDSYINNGSCADENSYLQRDRNVSYRVLVIDALTPEPDNNAGSHAVLQEMRMLQANGCKVSFVSQNMLHMGSYTENLQKKGVECFYLPFFNSVQQVLETRSHEYDAIYIVRYEVAERYIDFLRENTQSKIIFNNCDLHFLRELRAKLITEDKDFSGPLATRDKELALMRKVDAILTYNTSEHAVILSHNLRSDNLHICPWVVNVHGHRVAWEKREGLAFLGNYNHPPNVEAVEFFIQQIMPILRIKLPGVKFHIYGSNVPDSLKILESEDIIIEGYVENLSDVFETCRIFVVPLLSGAGLKGKVLEAMAHGIPSVLTPVAAESTGLVNDVSAMIVEHPDDWSHAITKLYKNKLTWQKLSENSLMLAKSNYNFERGVYAMRRILEQTGIYPPKHCSSLIYSN